MGMYHFIVSMVLAIFVGFSRLNHIRFVAKDPMPTRILKVLWAAAHVRLNSITLDTDTPARCIESRCGCGRAITEK